MNVTLKHLRAFAAVARQGSFTRAAGLLGLSQPALTLVVHQLEEAVGVKLFDRTTRRVRLTSGAAQFLPTAERLIEEFDAALDSLRDVAELRQGRVAVAALPSVAVRLLPEFVAELAAAYPGVRVHLYDDNASGVQQRVARGEVDFGLCSKWESPPSLGFRPLIRDRFGLVCRSDHPLGRRRGTLAWAGLEGCTFLGLARDTGIRPLVAAIENLPEAIRKPQFEASNLAALEGLLVAGLGVTVLPALAVPHAGEAGLVFHPLDGPALFREISVVTRSGRSLSPAAQIFSDLIVAQLPRRIAAVAHAEWIGVPGVGAGSTSKSSTGN